MALNLKKNDGKRLYHLKKKKSSKSLQSKKYCYANLKSVSSVKITIIILNFHHYAFPIRFEIILWYIFETYGPIPIKLN